MRGMMTEKETINRIDKSRDILHLIFTGIILIHIVFFVIYWIANAAQIPSVDGFIKGILKLGVPYVIIIVSLSALLGVWSILRMIHLEYQLKKNNWKKTHANWIYFVLAILFLAIFYGSLITITKMDHSQRGVLFRLLSVVRMLIDPLILFVVTILLRSVFKKIVKSDLSNKAHKNNTIFVVILFVFLAAWILPFIFLPQYIYFGKLPEKPKLLAHRGASMLAPENTLSAIKIADDFDAFAFESDVRVSVDGIPFLMHDDTLKRTTDVEELFPTRENDRAESFTMEELKNLNAGWWFILDDPYKAVKKGKITQSELTEYQSQSIPTLEETLELIKKTDMVLLYDLRYPPSGHPYGSNLFERVYEMLKAAKMEDQLWLLLDSSQVQAVSQSTPEIRRVLGMSSISVPKASLVASDGYQIINIDKGITNKDIKEFKEAGLAVNVYVVDQPWLISQLWICGVNSITTNNIQTLSKMNSPVWVLSFWLFLLIWALFGIALCIWLVSAGKWIKKEKTDALTEGELATSLAPVFNEIPTTIPVNESNIEGPFAEEPVNEILVEETETESIKSIKSTEQVVSEPEEVSSLLDEIKSEFEELEEVKDIPQESVTDLEEEVERENLITTLEETAFPEEDITPKDDVSEI